MLAAWIVLGLGATVRQALWVSVARHRPVPPVGVAIWGFVNAFRLLASAGLLTALAIAVPFRRRSPLRAGAAYVAAACLLALAGEWVEWYVGVYWLRLEAYSAFWNMLVGSYPRATALLLVVVALATAWRNAQEERKRAVEAARRDAQTRTDETRLQGAVAQAELDALRTELNPHFLFNALHALSAQARIRPEQAGRTAELVSSVLARHSAAEEQRVSLAEEIHGLAPYLELERVRFGDRLRLSWSVPTEMLSTEVPATILQPLVENAMKYAVAQRVDGAHVEVRASKAGDMVQLQVRDDGPGPAQALAAPGTGTGLTNLRARLQRLYGAGTSVTLEEAPEGGAVVTVRFPFDSPGATGPAAEPAQAPDRPRQRSTAAEELPSLLRSRAFWRPTLTLCLASATLETLAIYFDSKLAGLGRTLLGTSVYALGVQLSWAPIAAAAFAASERYPLRRKRMVSASIAHLLLAIGLALFWLGVAWVMANVVVTEGRPFTYTVLAIAAFPRTFAYVVGIFAIAYGVRAERLGRARALREVRLRAESETRVAALSTELVRQRTRALRLEMNPAFLRSAIDGIREMIGRDAATAQRMITSLGDLLRNALQRTASETVPLQRALDAVRPLIDLEILRSGEKLAVQLAVAADAAEVEVPRLLLQPVLADQTEWLRSGGGGTLRLAARKDGDQLVLAVDTEARSAPRERTTADSNLAAIHEQLHLGYGEGYVLLAEGDGARLRSLVMRVPLVPVLADPVPPEEAPTLVGS